MNATTTMNVAGLRYSWTTALTLLGLATVLTVALLWPSAVSITHIWLNSQTYAHGMMIIPLALFLAWTRRQELARVEPQLWAWGLLWIAVAGVAWVLARSVDVKTVQHFALVAMLPGLVLTLLGPRVAWILVFPLAYLFFAVPFGDFIVPTLMDHTAWFTIQLLKLSGVPVYSDGYYISIPAASFVVIEACSGVRYLIASLALGLVYAYLSYHSVWRRVAFMALAIVFPIIANGLRAYSIVMVAHVTDGAVILGYGHIVVGWVFFGVVMLLMFWLGSLWWDKDPGPRQASVSATANYGYVRASRLAVVLVALVAVLGAPRGAEFMLEQRALQVLVDAPATLPTAVAGWQGPEPAPDTWRPLYYDADRELAGVYRGSEDWVELHLFQYLNRGSGSQIKSWRNRVYDGSNWRRSSQGRTRITLPSGRELTVHETVLRGAGDLRRLVWHWYQVGDHVTTSGIEVKLREAQAALAGDGRGAFLVAVSTDEDILSLEAARQRMSRFVGDLDLPLGHGGG